MTIREDGDSPFRRAVLKQLENWVKENPTETVLGSADTGEALTRRDVYNQVHEHTQLGDQILGSWETLAADFAAEYVLSTPFSEVHQWDNESDSDVG